jgi:hypothetical protein
VNALTIPLIQLIAKVGLDAAIAIVDGLEKSASLADAIAALKAAQAKTAADYLAQAKANATP